MNTLEPYSYLQILNIMIVETQNELTRCKIQGRLLQREVLRGSSRGKTEQVLSLNQFKIKTFVKTIADLQEMHIEELAKNKSSGDTNHNAEKGD